MAVEGFTRVWSLSTKTTFDAVTHALVTTPLTDASGQKFGDGPTAIEFRIGAAELPWGLLSDDDLNRQHAEKPAAGDPAGAPEPEQRHDRKHLTERGTGRIGFQQPACPSSRRAHGVHSACRRDERSILRSPTRTAS